MRNTVAVFCLIVALTPFFAHSKQANSSPTQNPSTAARTQTNPIPDKFVNLQVLPKDITKPKLVNIMKQFCITFSVRCSYCHSVSDDLTEGTFDSDEKPTKAKTRELIKAIVEMNKNSPGG